MATSLDRTGSAAGGPGGPRGAAHGRLGELLTIDEVCKWLKLTTPAAETVKWLPRSVSPAALPIPQPPDGLQTSSFCGAVYVSSSSKRAFSASEGLAVRLAGIGRITPKSFALPQFFFNPGQGGSR